MGLFSRRARAAATTTPANENGNHAAVADKPVEEEPRLTVVAPVPLAEALQQLYMRKPTREAFAEEALRLIATSAGVRTAALFNWEPRKERLHLVAFLNLEPEALAVLAGQSALSTWDIPSRALRNKRISVIEAAHENPFVPKVLAAISPRRLTIATIPFYHASQPVGTVVLFSPTARGFGDKLLQTLGQGLRACALGLAELPSAAVVEGRPEETTADQPKLLRGLNALKAELVRLRQQLDESERQRTSEAVERVTAQSFLQAERDRIALLDKDLKTAREQLARLPGVHDELRVLGEQLAEVRLGRTAAEAKAEELAAALAGAQEHAEQRAVAVSTLEAARDDLQMQLEAALATAREHGEAGSALQDRLRELMPRAERVDALEETIAAAEKTNAALVAQLTGVQAQLGSELAARAAAELQLRQATDSVTAARDEVRDLSEQLIQARAQVRDLSATPGELAAVRAQLQGLEQTHAEAERELDAARAAHAALAHEQDGARQEWSLRVQALQGERDRLQDELARDRKSADERIAELLRQMEGAERDRDQMAGQIDELGVAQAERARLRARVEELEQDLVGQQEACRTLEQRIEEVGQVSARLIAERRDLHGRIETLAAGGQTLEQEKQAAINAAQERVTELEAELSQAAIVHDTARAAAAEELNRVRAELASTTHAREEAQGELDRLTTHVETLTTETKKQAAAHERLRTAREELARERDGLSGQLQTAAEELARLRQARADGDRGLAAIEAERGDAIRARDTLAAELRTLRDETLVSTSARLTSADRAREQLAQALAAERAQHAAEVASLQGQVERVREELGEQLAAAEREYTAECERLSQALAEKDLLLQSAEDDIGLIGMPTDGLSADDEVESELTIDRSSAPLDGEDLAADEVADLIAEVEDAGEVVFFDEPSLIEESERHLAQFGRQVSIIAPTAEAIGAIGNRRVSCAAINFSAPAAWSILRNLKEDPRHEWLPLVAYSLSADAPAGFWFGAVDFMILPVVTSLAEALARLAPRIKRVLAMSNDIDVMSDVRTNLTGAGISTAVVLDGRQALDLVPTVRPEAAVLHLSPSCVDVFRAVQGLRNAEISRDIPILFLLDAVPQPREEAFLSAGVRMLSARGNLRSDQLGAAISLMLETARPTPAAVIAPLRDHQQVPGLV